MPTTTTQTPPPSAEPIPAPAATTGLRPYSMTVDVYERIVASGAFGDKSRVFLWDGLLVEKGADMPRNRPHVIAVNALAEILRGLLRGHGFFVEQDQPLALGANSVPEPDLKCVRGANKDYGHHDPTPADCPLVIEVAESSLKDDQGEILQGYAAAGISTYWIVNLPHWRIDVYTQPTGPTGQPPAYAQHQFYGPEGHVPVLLDGQELGRVAVRDVLP